MDEFPTKQQALQTLNLQQAQAGCVYVQKKSQRPRRRLAPTKNIVHVFMDSRLGMEDDD